MILEIQNLNIVESRGWNILRDVSFAVKEGEKVGIVGESGSGKTVLVRSLINLLPPSMKMQDGTISYRGELLSKKTEREMQKIRGKEIGMVFQDPLTFLNPTLRIGIQIIEGYLRHFPTATKQEAKKRALQLLTQVGVPHPALRLLQYPHQLSGGLRQRVLIAIALAAEPSLLIADEPTTALDATLQSQIMHLLSSLHQTTLLISHDLSLVASFCDRILVMYGGQIIEDAPTDKLFRYPKHPYTQELLKSIPTLALQERLVTIPGSPPDLSLPISGCAFAPRCPHAMPRCHREEPPLLNNCRCWLES